MRTPTTVLLAWSTTDPEPSVAEIRGGSDDGWRTHRQDLPTRSHLLLVDGLQPGGSYAARIAGSEAEPLRFETPRPLSDEDRRDRVTGGFLGKVIGNEFGLPFEKAGLFEHNRAPFTEDLTDWDSTSDGVTGRVPVNHYVNDDTGLLLLGLLTVEEHGLEFSSRQHAERWLHHLAGYDDHLWCAEPYAVANFQKGIWPPESGAPANNPYALHLDAQMRADLYGLLAPGDPLRAADLAARDACLSNAGEGLDGARFVAAMVAAAFHEENPADLVRAGCAVLEPDAPHRRIAEDLLAWHRQSPTDWRSVWTKMEGKHAAHRYEPFDGHESSMILAAPNAGNIILALLYGESDFSRTISIAVTASWDTDCNAGNAGAVVGTIQGAAAIPAKWVTPLNDELSIRDFYGNLPEVLSIRAVAERIDRAGAR